MAKPLDIVSVGTALRDVMYYTDQAMVIKNPMRDPMRERLICVEFGAKLQSDNVHFLYGGGAANTAINFAGLGLRAGILTTIGDDLDGQGIAKHLAGQKVQTRLLQVSKKVRTGFSFLAVDEQSGEHTAYVFYGAASDLAVSANTLKHQPARWYYVSSLYTDRWPQVMRQLARTKQRIAWNPGSKQLKAGYRGLKPLLPAITILIVNRDEATELCASQGQGKAKANSMAGDAKAGSASAIEAMLQRIHGWGPKLVIITNSREGAHAYDGDQFYYQAAPNDKPLDTTGAGDCFGSSFVAGYIRYHGDIQRSMQLAQVNATALVHTVGAQQGLLKWKQLPKRLQQISPAKKK